MADEKFVVGCDGIGFHNGVVLVDLAGMSLTLKDAEGRPMREPRMRLVMTPDGMLETFNAMQGMVNRLLEVGLIKRNEPAAPTAPPVGAGTPQSPNFSN